MHFGRADDWKAAFSRKNTNRSNVGSIHAILTLPLTRPSNFLSTSTLIQECLGPLPNHYCAKLPKGLIPMSGTSSFDMILMELELPEGTLDFLHVSRLHFTACSFTNNCNCISGQSIMSHVVE